MSDATLQSLAQNVIEAYQTPRLSVRRIMSVGLSLQDGLLMVVAAFAIQAFTGELGSLLLSGVVGPRLGQRIAELAVQAAIFLMLAWGVHAIGRRFGGEGSKDECMAAVAWHLFATAFLAPFMLIGMNALTPDGSAPGILFFLAPLCVVVSVWMFASMVAEAHGFERLAPVVFATIIGFFISGLVAFILLDVVSGGPPGGS
ncbi:MAG: hypothetical protein AAF763_02915 [Pseudomonadota bacterium]